MKRLDSRAPGFEEQLRTLTDWDASVDADIEGRVRDIVQAVREQGDAAVLAYTARFDRLEVAAMDELEIDHARLQAALAGLAPEDKHALVVAADRIRAYHAHQLVESWEFTEADGTRLGQRVTPISRVGIYVPGGKAAYPSSVLMNAIPARVAGVSEIIMVVPAPDGQLNPLVLAAAAVAGVDRVFTIGGAQAVAALAYGTATIPTVDKIVGPGNIYVATAKRMVFGRVGIDMIAGPSEILILSDGQTDPDWLAMDLLSQAEHDEQAQSILVSWDEKCLNAVAAAVERALSTLERADIARTAWKTRGALVLARDAVDACAIANRVAPEHLELSVADPDSLLPLLRNAGAIFMGRHTPEALGDYVAGPNHVLPTAGSARFSSPLGVYDFQKRSSIIFASPAGADQLGRLAERLALGEGLTAHARSAALRTHKGS